MKKIVLALMILFATTAMAFAQSDLQVLAVVKLNKNESITLKQLKTQCSNYEKQLGKPLSLDGRKDVLNKIISDRLLIQAAAKDGISIPDSYVDQVFMQQMSQSIGRNVTEKEFAELIQKTQNKSIDQFMVEQTGMNTSEFKTYLKNLLIVQQYVIQKNQSGLQNVAASDDEIRLYYENNKSSFVWSDMLKLFIVIVPKGKDPDAAKLKLNGLLNSYKDKKLTAEQIIVQSQASGSGYQASTGVIPKTEIYANSIGMTYQNLLFVASQKEGFVSDIEETSNDYRFIALLKKYDAKMLGISDIVQPDTTVTVYDYIRSALSQQKQQEYLGEKAAEMAASLNTSDNVEMKKTGAALDKLMSWE